MYLRVKRKYINGIMAKSTPRARPGDDAESRERVGLDLRRARRAADLTQWDVAKRAACSQSTVAEAERGVPVSPQTMKRIVGAVLELAAERNAKP